MKSNIIYRLTLSFYEIHPLVLTFFGVIFVLVLTIINCKLSDNLRKKVNIAFFFISAVIIILLTLINRVTKNRSNYLIPFQNVIPLTIYRIQQITLNTLLFVPIGTSLPFCLNAKTTKPIRSAIILGFVLTISIEFLQLVLKRGTFETEDIITNTLGTAVGTLSFCIFTWYSKKK